MARKKYVVVDASYYRKMLSAKEGMEVILNKIEKLISKKAFSLVIPEQIEEEVNRNMLTDWIEEKKEAIKNKITSEKHVLNEVSERYKKYKFSDVVKQEINKRIRELERQLKSLKKPLKRSTGGRLVTKLIKMSELMPNSDEILTRAYQRTLKRNPPRDKEGHFGDCIIWETLLVNCKKGSDLTIVAVDGGWNNEYLRHEWRKKMRGALTIIDTMNSLVPARTPRAKNIKKKNIEKERRTVTDIRHIYHPEYTTSNLGMTIVSPQGVIQPNINTPYFSNAILVGVPTPENTYLTTGLTVTQNTEHCLNIGSATPFYICGCPRCNTPPR